MNIIRTNWGKISAVVALIGLLIIGGGFISNTSARATKVEVIVESIQTELPKKMDADICELQFKQFAKQFAVSNKNLAEVKKMVTDIHEDLYLLRDFKAQQSSLKQAITSNNGPI